MAESSTDAAQRTVINNKEGRSFYARNANAASTTTMPFVALLVVNGAHNLPWRLSGQPIRTARTIRSNPQQRDNACKLDMEDCTAPPAVIGSIRMRRSHVAVCDMRFHGQCQT